jgi:excisionase family DNA binding protein
MTVMDEDAATASAALVSFLHAFARLIAQEVRGQPQASLLKGETRPGTLQDRKLLTVQEAADVLQVKSKRVYEISHWKGADGLRCVRIGRQIRFRMDDIQDYLERRARGGPLAALLRVVPNQAGQTSVAVRLERWGHRSSIKSALVMRKGPVWAESS